MRNNIKTISASLLFFAGSFIIVVICIIFLILGYDDPIKDILFSGLTPQNSAPLFKTLPYYFSLDYLFIFSWASGWVLLLKKPVHKNKLIASTIFLLAILCPFFDFFETTLSISLIYSHFNYLSPSFWLFSRDLSYIAPYFFALFYGILIFKKGLKNILMTIISVSGIIVWLLSLACKGLWFAVYIWWPLWFLFLGIYYSKKNRC